MTFMRNCLRRLAEGWKESQARSDKSSRKIRAKCGLSAPSFRAAPNRKPAISLLWWKSNRFINIHNSKALRQQPAKCCLLFQPLSHVEKNIWIRIDIRKLVTWWNTKLRNNRTGFNLFLRSFSLDFFLLARRTVIGTVSDSQFNYAESNLEFATMAINSQGLTFRWLCHCCMHDSKGLVSLSLRFGGPSAPVDCIIVAAKRCSPQVYGDILNFRHLASFLSSFGWPISGAAIKQQMIYETLLQPEQLGQLPSSGLC